MPRKPGIIGLDQLYEVETPEQVELSYTIAGLGSRLFAGVIDILVVIAGFLVLLVAMAVIGLRVPLWNVAGSWALAILLLAQFAFMWGYYVLCEGLADGRTVGKRALRLRVVHDDGLSITFAASAIRNIFRLVDLQPGVFAGVGIVSIVLSSRGKRIGDIVAGTIVVRERPIAVVRHRESAPAVAPGEPALSGAQFDLLHRYVERRLALQPADRARLTRLVANRLRPQLAAHAGTDAAALVRLYEGESALRSRGVAARSDRGAAREHHALIVQKKPRWAEFAVLLERAQRRGLSGLSEQEVSEFAAQYREITADLARLKTAARGRLLDEVFYLGRLVAAGHNLLYRRQRIGVDRALSFLAADAPREIRRSAGWILAAAALFWVPAGITYAGVVRDPGLAADFLPRGILDRAEAVRAQPERGYVLIPELERPVVASSIIANNVQVSLAAFAFGITLGIGTALILLFNGIALGGVAAVFAAKGVGSVLLGFVAPHGVLELSAIAIAGGAGLLVGGGVIVPGPGGRRVTLIAHTRRAITLMGAVVLLLLVAGLIEGLISPRTDQPLTAKLAVSAATAIALAAYIAFGGRASTGSDRAASLELEVPVDNGGGKATHGNVHDVDA